MLKIVKTYNLENTPVTFKTLKKESEQHKASRFIREAESWAMIVNRWDAWPEKTGVVFEVTKAGDASLAYYEKYHLKP